MFFHITVTNECNMQCRYCFGEALEDTGDDFAGFEIDYSLPKKINYDLELLKRFCRRDPDCVVTFYGGEPLLEVDLIKQIMDRLKAQHFMIQTNGLLLDRLESEYVNRFHTILVSLDGDEDLTDYYRGKGAFAKVISNLKLIHQNGFRGELIARMTVMEQTDILKQVVWLTENAVFPFLQCIGNSTLVSGKTTSEEETLLSGAEITTVQGYGGLQSFGLIAWKTMELCCACILS